MGDEGHRADRTTPGYDLAAVERLKDAFARLKAEMGKVIVGQEAVLEELLIAIFARGHCLLIGVPGLAKTLMIHTLADALNLTFNRIQFTPDLMPSDITGTEVIQEDKATGVRQFKFLRGPIFANIVLADEINRTPPKTQAALLEAMQEHQVTVGGERHRLPDPFFVLATQNPIEQEGTYPLPEAQLDRFMFNILVDYPDEEEELEIVRLTTSVARAERRRRSSPGPTSWSCRRSSARCRWPTTSRATPCGSTRLTRREKERGARLHPRLRELGRRPARQPVPGARRPRPAPCCYGRYYVSTDDIRAVAGPVLRHRIITNFNAEAEGLKPDDIVKRLIKAIPVDEHEAEQSGKLPKYLNPQTLASLEGLDLQARLVVEGYVAGMHPSPYHGFSVEFAEHREYVPGDDIRHVDWKVWSKTDKLYLKQYEEETNLLLYLLLDTSESMAYASGAERHEAPVRAVRRRVAGVHGPPAAGLGRPGHLRRHGPPLPQAGGPAVAPEGADPRDGRRPRAARSRTWAIVFHDLAERFKKRGVVAILSDLFDDVPRIIAGPEALPAPAARGDRLPHPRPGRARLPVPRHHPVQGAGRAARGPDRAARPAAGLPGRDRRLSRRAEEGLPDDRHRLRPAADRPDSTGAVELPGVAGDRVAMIPTQRAASYPRREVRAGQCADGQGQTVSGTSRRPVIARICFDVRIGSVADLAAGSSQRHQHCSGGGDAVASADRAGPGPRQFPLLCGLAAASVPLIIHLLNKRKYPRDARGRRCGSCWRRSARTRGGSGSSSGSCSPSGRC